MGPKRGPIFYFYGTQMGPKRGPIFLGLRTGFRGGDPKGDPSKVFEKI